MPGAARVQVTGLRELRRDLKKVQDAESLKDVRDALKDAAGIVAKDAAGRLPRRTGNAAGSLRATAGGNTAYVVGGKSSVPYYGWLDFGSRTPASGNPRSVGPWTGTGPGPRKGRAIYPALDARERDVVHAVEAGMDRALNKENL